MYLSQIRLNPRDIDYEKYARNCHRLHQLVMKGFPKGTNSRSAHGVLFRFDPRQRTILVQSATRPEWSHIPANFVIEQRVKHIPALSEYFEGGDTLLFHLKATPNTKENDRRVPLFDDMELHRWITLKGERWGFRVDPQKLLIGQPRPIYGYKSRGGFRLTFNMVTYRGYLTVTDKAKFIEGLRKGLGSGKAYGFGMMSIRRADV